MEEFKGFLVRYIKADGAECETLEVVNNVNEALHNVIPHGEFISIKEVDINMNRFLLWANEQPCRGFLNDVFRLMYFDDDTGQYDPEKDISGGDFVESVFQSAREEGLTLEDYVEKQMEANNGL